jgi:hypothetical protein
MADTLGAVGATPAVGGAEGGAADGGGIATEIETPTEGAEGGEGETGGEGAAEGEGGEPAGPTTEDGTEGEGGAEAESDGSEYETDGRKIDDATKKALAALKKVDPASAKRVAEAYFKRDAYQKVFPTVHEARGAKATIEALGGQQGIQDLQSEVGDYRTEITQFAKGDPELINNLWEANPEGVEMSTAASIALIGEKDADMFDRVIAPAMVARLEKAGLYKALPTLANFIKEGKGQEAYDLLLNISKFFDNAKTLQAKQLDLKQRVDPERKKFDQERQEFEQQKSREYEGRIAVNANQLNNKAMSKVVEPFFREIKLSTDGRRRFVQNLQSEVWAAMKADKAFQMQARTIQKKGDAGETADFISEKFEELLPGIFRTLRNSLYPNYARMKGKAPAAAAGKNGAAAAAGANKNIALAAGARPKHNDVDWDKTSSLDWIRGNATLVNGKRIKFDVNAPANKI